MKCFKPIVVRVSEGIMRELMTELIMCKPAAQVIFAGTESERQQDKSHLSVCPQQLLAPFGFSQEANKSVFFF